MSISVLYRCGMLPGRTHACQKSCRSNPTTLIQSRPRNYPECSCPTVPHSSCADSRFLVVLLTSCFLKQANASTKFPQPHSHSKLPQRRRQPILRTIGRRRPSNLRRHIPLDQRDKCNEVTSDGFFHSAVACEFSTRASWVPGRCCLQSSATLWLHTPRLASKYSRLAAFSIHL